MRQFTPTELKSHLDAQQSQPLLLDVREPWEYKICRLDGAELVPMRKIPTYMEQLDKSREIVVICHHGIRSLQVCRYMEQAGFGDLINLQGGVAGWARDVDPAMAVY